MKLWYCRNEASVEMLPLKIEEAPIVERPVLRDKTEYRRWCADPTTDHAFVTFAEGESANLRVGKDNPCRRVWGIVAEYDARVPADWRELVRTGVGGMEVSEAWFCRSFSGNGRILFPFAEPVLWSCREEWEAFCDIAFSELKLGKLLPGFSDKESRSVTMIFEIGTEWERVGGEKGQG